MCLLGVDVGTTGCKAAAFLSDGTLVASAYREYDVRRPRPGCAELDAVEVWGFVKEVIAETAAQCGPDPVSALCVSSLGEAVVPVSEDRRILGPSILNFDERGAEYLAQLAVKLPNARLYEVNGNTLGNHYSLTKLMHIRDHEPQLYERTFKFLHWAAFVSFMLGAEPRVDYSLANRTLLFDLSAGTWSPELLRATGIDRAKLPDTVPSGTVIGHISPAVARELGLPANVSLVSGAHDQCANALGCGVYREGQAMLGMGTFMCIVPVFSKRMDSAAMMRHGLNTEHHAAPGKYVCFIYNHAGSLLKWYRDTLAARERDKAKAEGRDIYAELIAEIPGGPSDVLVLPHFAATGPPDFISDSSGVMTGLRLGTTRGEILKGILEGAVFYMRECLDPLPNTGISIDEFRAVGGGSKSDTWLQICADILGVPVVRAKLAEAGALGSAVLAGAATGVFASGQQGADAMVRLDRSFEPDPATRRTYDSQFERYRRLWPSLQGVLRGVR